MRKNIIFWTLLLSGLAFLAWVVFKPEYELTYYRMRSCPDIYVTKILYRQIGERGVAFAYGKHEGESLPSKECFYTSGVSGIGSYYAVILTCENGKIVINYNEGNYRPVGKASKIVGRRLTSPMYYKLSRDVNALAIDGS